MFAPDGRGPLMGRTADISSNGVNVTFDDPIEVNVNGTVRFDLLVDGKITHVNTRSKVLHCIFGGGQFKVGFQFTGLDPATSSALSRFLR